MRPSRRGMGLVALGVVLGASIGACKPRRQGTPPLCSFQSATDAEIESQTLPPEAWLPLVSPSIDRASMVRTGPWRDACGRVLEPEPAAAGCPPDDARVVSRPGDPVSLDDLVLGQVGEGRMVGWAATDDLSDGEAVGPAALVFWTESGVDVHATGLVRAAKKSARLRLHHSGGKPVVIVEGERCDAEGKCTPEATFVPIVARKLRDVPVYDAEGACLGRARFELTRRIEQPNPGGLTRRFELQRTIELAEEGIVLIDLVTGDEIDPADPTATAKPFRKVSTRRALDFDGQRFVVRDRDLWTHVLRDYGLVRDDGEAPRERSGPDAEEGEGGITVEEKKGVPKGRGDR